MTVDGGTTRQVAGDDATAGNSNPGWVWLIAGLALGIGADRRRAQALAEGRRRRLLPSASPIRMRSPARRPSAEGRRRDRPRDRHRHRPTPRPTSRRKPQYDFYTLLPGKEVPLSDAELAASAREEEAREARGGAAGGRDSRRDCRRHRAAGPADPAMPAHRPPRSRRATTAASATKPAAAAASAQRRALHAAGRRVRPSGDAEAVKAKIAMLGLARAWNRRRSPARPSTACAWGRTARASELADAKRSSSSGGLPAMAIKAR